MCSDFTSIAKRSFWLHTHCADFLKYTWTGRYGQRRCFEIYSVSTRGENLRSLTISELQQYSQCTYNVTMMRVRTTIVAVWKQWLLHTVCVCSFSYSGCNFVFFYCVAIFISLLLVTVGSVYSKMGCNINILKPTGHVTHQQFNIQQLYALPTLYLCVLYLSQNKQRLVPLTA